MSELTLPLHNPVLIFSLLLFIILATPILLNRLKIPHLIGMIIAGAVIGPHGLNLMQRDSAIVLFGTVGLLYIMFMAGLEIDIAEFKKNSRRSVAKSSSRFESLRVPSKSFLEPRFREKPSPLLVQKK